jgi:parvulin-like peptidyl-prolyl isomerase
LRKNTKIFLWFAASVFILATFMGLGGYFFTRTPDAVARINGKKISYETFNNVYYERLNSYRNMYNADINEQMATSLKKMVLEDMIRRELMLQEAKKEKIKISDADLSNYIQQFPYFQKNGLFNQQQYLAVLKTQVHMTPAQFENEVRQSLILTTLRDKVTTNLSVTDQEVTTEQAKRAKDNKTKTSAADLEKEKVTVREALIQEKKSRAFEAWFNLLRAKSKVENNLDAVEKMMAGKGQE